MKINNRLSLPIILIALTALLLSGCGLVGNVTPTPYPENTDGEEDQFIGMPNPASFYCQEMGYELDMRENDRGTEGTCVFPNGTECEEWEFLSGGCANEWSFCQRQGYTIQAGEGMATCVFPDGSSCPEYEFFIGECQPPQ